MDTIGAISYNPLRFHKQGNDKNCNQNKRIFRQKKKNKQKTNRTTKAGQLKI